MIQSQHEVTGGKPVAWPSMREETMKPADAGDEKLGTDTLRGDELADDDLEGVTGGLLNPIVESAAKEDAPSRII